MSSYSAFIDGFITKRRSKELYRRSADCKESPNIDSSDLNGSTTTNLPFSSRDVVSRYIVSHSCSSGVSVEASGTSSNSKNLFSDFSSEKSLILQNVRTIFTTGKGAVADGAGADGADANSAGADASVVESTAGASPTIK